MPASGRNPQEEDPPLRFAVQQQLFERRPAVGGGTRAAPGSGPGNVHLRMLPQRTPRFVCAN